MPKGWVKGLARLTRVVFVHIAGVKHTFAKGTRGWAVTSGVRNGRAYYLFHVDGYIPFPASEDEFDMVGPLDDLVDLIKECET